MTWTPRPQKPPFAVPPIQAGDSVRRLGPFTINYNTPDIANGIEVADLEAGTVVQSYLGVVRTPWNSDNSVSLAVGVGQDTNDFSTTSGMIDAGSGPFGGAGYFTNIYSDGFDIMDLCDTACKLIVQVNLSGSEPSEGSVDLYAFIVEP